MADLAHELTEDELDALRRKFKREYSSAAKSVEARAAEYLEEIKPEAERLRQAMIDASDDKTYRAAKRKYERFMQEQTIANKRFQDLQAQLASDISAVNQASAAEIASRMNRVFAVNHNFAAYQLEHGLGMNLQFTLYDERTVARLIRENPRLLPKPSIDIAKDLAWNQQKITSQITQGILAGEPLPKVAARLQNVTGMNYTSAVRNAQSAMSAAQSAGRIESYHYAESIGISLKKEWLATLDGHTRDEHRALDGKKVGIDDPFEIGGETIMYPGDPDAPGHLVYGCRCTLISDVDGIDDLDPVYRRDNISGKVVADMSYSEWEAARSG